MTAEILIVEDEPKLAAVLADYVAREGMISRQIGRGDEVEAALLASPADVILLDLNLPGLDGIEVCRRIRGLSMVPIIMLTARVEEVDRLIGLGSGADDYVCKPYSPREVMARVKAVLRRSQPGKGATRTLELDPASHRVRAGTRQMELSAIEFRMLQTMHAAPGRIFSRDQLIDSMYDDHRVVSGRTVDSHVKKMRRKLAIAFPGLEVIHSVYGAGYRYEE